MSELISIEEARRRVLGAVRPLGTEAVGLDAALGRVLAQDVRSPIDVPPFDNSAMDGYAVIAGPEAELELIGESRAGRPAAEAVRAGTAIRVSTGAELPAGADAVVPVERAEANGASVRVGGSEPGANVRRAGEDMRAGETVLPAPVTLGPAELGVAAAVGCARLECALRPRVAVLVTGDELVEPGRELAGGQIYSSNGYALSALVDRSGAELVARESVADSAEATRRAFAGALERADVLCVSGGVSVGPHDHVKGALRELGVEERFWGVSLRPGKPTWFGTRDGVLVFGLPGNPVSAMVTFTLFVRPALAALQGADLGETRIRATLTRPVERNPRREHAVRVSLERTSEGWSATPTGAQGSHVLTSMLGADGLARLDPGEGGEPAGSVVEVQLL